MQESNILKFTHYNFIDKVDETENEDAVNTFESEKEFRIAISDGAGAAGIYCRDWAHFLVAQQPEKPFSKDESNAWFLGISEEFYLQKYKTINKSDSFILEKFNTEGSYATVLYVWFNKTNNQLSYSGIGDTTLFIFRSTQGNYEPILITPINEQKSIDDFPKLINWNKSLEYDLASKHIDLLRGDILVLCTDCLARWLIYNMLVLEQYETQRQLGEDLSKSIDKNILEEFKLRNKYQNLYELLKRIKYSMDKGGVILLRELEKKVNEKELDKDDYSLVMKII